jgi:hypothetical protein
MGAAMEEFNKTHKETTFGWVLWLQEWAARRAARDIRRQAQATAPRLLTPR